VAWWAGRGRLQAGIALVRGFRHSEMEMVKSAGSSLPVATTL
jgi:hypothetical protein